MLDVIGTAVIEFLLELLPATRRGRMVLGAFIALVVGIGVAALVLVL